MILNFKKLNTLAAIPTKADDGAAGYDLTAINVQQTGGIITIHTGIAMEIPEGYAGFLFPRSSVYKTGLSLANSVGVIDSSYRGEIMCKFRIVDQSGIFYKVGERCCQIVIMPVCNVEFIEQSELTSTSRGSGGFGSSGK